MTFPGSHIVRSGSISGMLAMMLIVPVFGLSLQQTAHVEKADTPVPDIRQLMIEVMDHQKQLEKVRENYTYTTSMTTQDLDSSGKVTKTETEETEVFYVNTHRIERTVKKNGKPLDEHDEKKE